MNREQFIQQFKEKAKTARQLAIDAQEIQSMLDLIIERDSALRALWHDIKVCKPRRLDCTVEKEVRAYCESW